MLINLSNHPSANWSKSQLAEAAKYGQVFDLPFPAIKPEAETGEILQLAQSFEAQVSQLLTGKNAEPNAVHLMGELTFCFALVVLLQRAGIICIASTTSRKTTDHSDGLKSSLFEFVRYREYVII